MREILILTRAALVNNFNLHGLHPRNYRTKRARLMLLFFVVIFLSLIPSYVLYIRFVRQVGMSLLMINQERYFIGLFQHMAVFLVFFLGLMYVLSYYYFSRDTDMLIPLPVKGRSIVVSKFLAVLVFEYLVVGVFFIPVLAVNASFAGSGLWYFLRAAYVFLLVPVLPLAIASILVIALMRVTNVKGRKDLIRLAGMFLFLFFVLGGQIFVQNRMMQVPPGEEQAFFAQLFQDSKALIDMLSRVNPLSGWSSQALYVKGAGVLVPLALLGVSNAGAFLLMVLAGEKLYLGGIVGGKESQARKKALTREQMEKAAGKPAKAVLSIFKVDFLTLMKTPIFMFNCVSIVVLVPFLLLAMPVLTGTVSGMEMLQGLLVEHRTLFTFGTAGAHMLLAAMNPTASTAFSREGKCFWITRTIPARPWEQIGGKALSPLLLQVVTVAVVSGGIRFHLPMRATDLALAALLGIAGSLPLILLGLLIDINRPLLSWDNPQRAVKQNMNVLFAMGAGALLTAGIGFAAYRMIRAEVSALLLSGSILFVLLLLAALLYRVLVRRMLTRFATIEE
ncbi:hypothetical protein [Anaerotalea alkaliphila]|uniref:ABC-2 type transport system permease protein n=1 Tax=Anaerotalea alkaliphila TaxID=2662126 RepID=A0A7X5KN70_9FIRM|nr:hypothetical protein [Anaerotalea alkaliphila]NDL67473.1 hypothetical protein [Anaerotalea alkaliphila]